MPISVETILSRLGGTSEAARITGVGTEAVRKWRQSNTIPAKHWLIISQKTGLPVQDFQPIQSSTHEDSTKLPQPRGATALLLLEDGTHLWGYGIGAHTTHPSVGEICFSTSMTGYQETASDPSYAEQIIVFTTPHIGNVGTNKADNEYPKPLTKGLVVHDVPPHPSNFRCEETLPRWLQKNNIAAISGIDTRSLTRKIRKDGPQKSALFFPKDGHFPLENIHQAIKDWPGLKNRELAAKVSCRKPFSWHESVPQGYSQPQHCPGTQRHIVVIDYGVKQNILRCLVSCGCRVTVVPPKTPSKDILAIHPHGILLSNGPGDPSATAKYAVPIIQALIKAQLPIMGICLGHQLLTHAFGMRTFKMKRGHRGVNQPVKNGDNGRVIITSQNHGFATEKQELPNHVKENYVSLFDHTNEGITCNCAPIYAVQFHPEAAPGPSDGYYLFEDFMRLIDKHHPSLAKTGN